MFSYTTFVHLKLKLTVRTVYSQFQTRDFKLVVLYYSDDFVIIIVVFPKGSLSCLKFTVHVYMNCFSASTQFHP